MRLKNRIFVGLGSSLEWFDFAVYGFLAPIFSKLFFSHTAQNHSLSLLLAYAVFAIGFASRPIGGFLFGYLGDKYGRVPVLKSTPLFITFASIMIAFLPSYQTAGNLSISLLILFRIIQGILLGGEFAGNVVYLCESSKKAPYFWGGIASCTGGLGIIFASLIASIFYHVFSELFMYEYGWRIIFLFSLPLGLFSFWIRRNITETADFIIRKTTKINNPITEVIKYHKKTRAMIESCVRQ